MDVSSLFSGVDNLFKFLFIGGLVMLLTSMFYPLQKEQELDIEINSYNKEVKLLNRELGELRLDVSKLNKSSSEILAELRTLKQGERTKSKLKKSSITKQIKDIKANFKTNYDSLYKRKQTTEIKEIVLDFNKSKIILLKKYSDSYGDYTSKLTWWGIAFIVIGLVGWIISTITAELLKIKELKKP
ncbi:hypothetical protein [Mucilaginibacter sp. FT3.2]|uniref:hypothetical protein n=1 Tax=Mucilaginibacter sp. FT3.2 TaxID=2723090 RepID=UPI00160D7EFE|nr:hypothetical protein [Mucilaginibacter sp. FT3.2]MBB6230866.1 preprotein translocase subunit Sss1 [Mucilaginibacter sp. FT3.2]